MVYQLVISFHSFKYQYEEPISSCLRELREGLVHTVPIRDWATCVRYRTHSMWRGNHIPSRLVNYCPKEQFQVLNRCLAMLIMAITIPFIATRKIYYIMRKVRIHTSHMNTWDAWKCLCFGWVYGLQRWHNDINININNVSKLVHAQIETY